MTNDFFHSLGKIPWLSERLNKICKGLIREYLHDFKNEGGIPSGPTPECSFKVSSASKIYTSDICQELMLKLNSCEASNLM